MGEVFQSSCDVLKINQSHEKQVGLKAYIRHLYIGLVLLILGSGFYYFLRSAERIYFLEFFGINPSTKIFLSSLFVTIGNSLPAFILVVAFSLMTAAFIDFQKRGYVIVCLLGFAIDVLFEVMQGFDTSVT